MAAKGEKLEHGITWETLQSLTEGGWTIFVKEIGGKFPVSRAFRSPLRKDKAPSFTIFKRDGKWLYKDWSYDEVGDALKFVMRRYGLSFREAMDKICQDLGLSQTNNIYQIREVVEKAPEWVESDVHISFFDRKWGKEHYKFWENTGVTQEHCLKYDTFAVKDYAISRRKGKMGQNEVVWAYYARDIDKVKLYFPEREKGNKFRGNVPGNYIWNINNVEKCDKILVQKSNKDMLCSLVIMPCVIATMTEHASIFTDEIVRRIHSLSKKVWIAYGSDRQGVEQSTLLSEKYKWKWINPPKELLPEINDIYSLEKKYGQQAWVDLLKEKKLL